MLNGQTAHGSGRTACFAACLTAVGVVGLAGCDSSQQPADGRLPPPKSEVALVTFTPGVPAELYPDNPDFREFQTESRTFLLWYHSLANLADLYQTEPARAASLVERYFAALDPKRPYNAMSFDDHAVSQRTLLTLEMLYKSPELFPDRRAILRALYRDHVPLLERYLTRTDINNHGFFAIAALLEARRLFPAEFRHIQIARLKSRLEQLVWANMNRKDFITEEGSSAYHFFFSRLFSDFRGLYDYYSMVDSAGLLAKAAENGRFFVLPNGRMLPLGDTSYETARAEPAFEGLHNFEDYSFFRRADTHLFINHRGKPRFSHMHYDDLSLDFYHGKPVLTDSGGPFSYTNMEGRNNFLNRRMHNVPLVDGRGDVMLTGVTESVTEPMPGRVEARIRATYPDAGSLERTIVLDSDRGTLVVEDRFVPDDDREHVVEVYYHFDPAIRLQEVRRGLYSGGDFTVGADGETQLISGKRDENGNPFLGFVTTGLETGLVPRTSLVSAKRGRGMQTLRFEFVSGRQ